MEVGRYARLVRMEMMKMKTKTRMRMSVMRRAMRVKSVENKRMS